MSSVVAAHASCGAGLAIFAPGIGGLAPSVLDCGNILYFLRLGLCPGCGKGCGVGCPTVCRAGSVSLNRGGNNCIYGFFVLRIVFAHASCGASRSVSREIVGYRPLVLKCGYVFDLNGLNLRPLLSKCCGIGGLTHFLTYCGNSYFRGDGCIYGFFVLRIVFAHAGCGAGLAIFAPYVFGLAPLMSLGSKIEERHINKILLCFVIYSGIVSISALGTADNDITIFLTERVNGKTGISVRAVYVNAVVFNGMISDNAILGNILRIGTAADGEIIGITGELNGVNTTCKLYLTAGKLNLACDLSGSINRNCRNRISHILA